MWELLHEIHSEGSFLPCHLNEIMANSQKPLDTVVSKGLFIVISPITRINLVIKFSPIKSLNSVTKRSRPT